MILSCFDRTYDVTIHDHCPLFTTIMALDKESVTIAINRSTDSTPVFVAGTFSEPHWEPFELSAKRIPSSTEFVFSHDFEVSPGQYHYHFREGAGGAWFHDDAVKNGTYKQLILQNT